MKFRGKLSKVPFSYLRDIALHFSKIGNSCIVILHPTEFQLAMKENGDEIQAFASLTPSYLFEECTIQSKADNYILFSINISMLCKALTSGKDAPLVVLKLVKRNNISCLSLETKAVDVKIVHDIPIDLISASERSEYCQPQVPLPNVHIEMPCHRQLRPVIDRLKGMEQVLYIDAAMNGTMQIKVDTDSFTIKTFYTQLQARLDLQSDATQENAEVCVSSKHFSKAIGCTFGSTLCCITENHALVLHTIVNGNIGTITIFIPILCRDTS